jgi:hypothetical protein
MQKWPTVCPVRNTSPPESQLSLTRTQRSLLPRFLLDEACRGPFRELCGYFSLFGGAALPLPAASHRKSSSTCVFPWLRVRD